MHRQSFFLVPLICLSSALWAAPATVNVEVLQDKLDHPWALAFFPDNHGMSLCAAASCVTGKQEKDYLRRFPEFRTFGRTGRAACWTWF